MRNPTVGFVLALFISLSCSSPPPPAEAPNPEFEGTWNVTEEAGGRQAASWLKIEADQAGGWAGRYLHRGGHHMPARVEIEGNTVRVEQLPEAENPPAADAKFPTLIGTLESGELKGTGTDRQGNEFSWTGKRAPDRLEGSDRQVTWGEPIELFNGENLDGWTTIGTRESEWQVSNGELENVGSGANIRTADTFRDFKLHAEFKIPEGSNSGIYLRGRYETQVADNYGEEPHSRRVGGVYGQITPKSNPVKPAGEWNTVDATIIGYRITIAVNGETTIDGELLPGITGGAQDANESLPGPIVLQGDHGPVAYRNIVLTPAP
jgi:hypothetical protein